MAKSSDKKEYGFMGRYTLEGKKAKERFHNIQKGIRDVLVKNKAENIQTINGPRDKVLGNKEPTKKELK